VRPSSRTCWLVTGVRVGACACSANDAEWRSQCAGRAGSARAPTPGRPHPARRAGRGAGRDGRRGGVRARQRLQQRGRQLHRQQPLRHLQPGGEAPAPWLQARERSTDVAALARRGAQGVAPWACATAARKRGKHALSMRDNRVTGASAPWACATAAPQTRRSGRARAPAAARPARRPPRPRARARPCGPAP